ncbi:MAG: RNA-binding protein [Phycisphaerales bacterium]|nr:RNA-binding protein [Phycisphaerales bacterium]
MAKGLFKIYVGNLDYKVTEFSVRRLFEPYGDIEDIAMATDKETGKPRGFAIVMMRDHEQAQTAIDGVKGRKLMGRDLVVNEAIKKKGSQKATAPEGAPVSRSSTGATGSRPAGGYRARASAHGRGEGRGSSATVGSRRNPRRGSSSGGRNPRRGGGGH